MRSMAPALCLLLVSLAFGVAASLWPPESGRVLVLFAHGVDGTTAFRRVVAAGGAPLNVYPVEHVVLVQAEAGFGRRLTAQGAALIVDARSIRGCGND